MSSVETSIAQESPKLIWWQGFNGINNHETRQAIADQEMFWCENFMPLGAGNLRTLYDIGTPIFSAPGGGHINYGASFNIGATFYDALFLADGSAVAVNQVTGATAVMGTAGTFATGPTLPHVAQYGASGIIFVTASSSGYYAWDGTLYSPGQTAPTWLRPSGATSLTMPTGLSGSALETFQGHVWIVNGAVCTFSAPGDGANFATSSGGGSFTSTDGFLKVRFVGLKQCNGFLYILGDSSINVISNVQTTGTTPTTTFNNQNVDPQTGLGWRDTLVAFGRVLVFANPTGVYALFGGAAEKISAKIDGLFLNATFTVVTPSMCISSIFSVRSVLLLMQTIDPTSGTTRTLLIGWTGEKWFVVVPSLTAKLVLTSQANATPAGWMSDGVSFAQLFVTPSPTLSKRIQSKFWGGDAPIIFKKAMRVYAQTKDNAGTGAIVNGTVDADTRYATGPTSVSFSLTATIQWQNNLGQNVNWLNNLNQPVTWISSPPGITGADIDQAGLLLGLTLSSTSQDMTLIAAGLGYEELGVYS